MRPIMLISLLVLAGCQPPLPPEAPPAPAASTGISPERRALLDTCLVEMGKPPLPEVLKGINAPMNRAEAEVFKACLDRLGG